MFKSIVELEKLDKKQLICEILVCQAFIYFIIKNYGKEEKYV